MIAGFLGPVIDEDWGSCDEGFSSNTSGQVRANERPNEISGGCDPIGLRTCSRREGIRLQPWLFNLKGLAGLCQSQSLIRLLSFTICQPNRLRKRCTFAPLRCSEYRVSRRADSVSACGVSYAASNSDKRLQRCH